MNYYLDSEFIEDGKTIRLISLGIVAEDGREYYAQFADTSYEHASEWVHRHVLSHLASCTTYPGRPYDAPKSDPSFGKAIHAGQIGKIKDAWVHCDDPACPWRSNWQVKQDLLDFLNPERYGKPRIWTYYGAYDWVALCQFFGKMIDLPAGWPMYTHDLRPWLDDHGHADVTQPDEEKHHALDDARWIARTHNAAIHAPPMEPAYYTLW